LKKFVFFAQRAMGSLSPVLAAPPIFSRWNYGSNYGPQNFTEINVDNYRIQLQALEKDMLAVINKHM